MVDRNKRGGECSGWSMQSIGFWLLISYSSIVKIGGYSRFTIKKTSKE